VDDRRRPDEPAVAAAPADRGEFVLVNRNSGKVLDAKGGGTADGVTLIQYRDVGSCNQGCTFHRVTG
jgi:hypothetical protein